MTVTIASKTQTFTNGTPNDAGPVDSEFTALFNNDTALKTKVDNLLGGAIEDGTSVTINSLFAGSPSSNISIIAERGSSTNTLIRWNETTDLWEVSHDGTYFAPLSYAAINAQTGTTYTVVTGDRGKDVTFSNASSIAVTLPQANTTGFTAGFYFKALNLGAGTVTITPTTSTINGASTLVLATNQHAEIFSNGTNYFAFIGSVLPSQTGNSGKFLTTDGSTPSWGAAGSTRFISTTTASGAASINIPTGLTSTYSEYIARVKFLPATDDTQLYLKVTEDGLSYVNSAGAYSYTNLQQAAGGSLLGGANNDSDTQMIIGPRATSSEKFSNATARAVYFNIRIFSPSNTTENKEFSWSPFYHRRQDGNGQLLWGGACYKATTNAITGFQLLMSSGNITATVNLYGVLNA